MSNLRQAAQQALGALEQFREISDFTPASAVHAITALRAALAEPEQKPVGWQWLDTANYRKKLPANAIPEHWRPLYTAPTPRKPLTDEEIDELSCSMVRGDKSVNWLCRAIERAHGIGEQT